MNQKNGASLLRSKAVVTTMVIVSVLSVGFIVWAVASTPKEPNPIEERNELNAGGKAGTTKPTPPPAGGSTFDNGNVRVQWNKGSRNEIEHGKHATPPPTGKSGKMY